MQKYGTPEPIQPDPDQAPTPEGITAQAGLQPDQTWTPQDSAELVQENIETDQPR